MKYIATDEAIENLNKNKITEHEIRQEFNSRWKAIKDGNMGDIIINWKNKDVAVSPIGKSTALLFVYGQEINKSYEDIPEVKYKNDVWERK